MPTSVRKTATPRRRTAPRGSERRLVIRHPRRQILSLAAGAAALPALSRMTWAQAYPTKPITLIVPYAAGGPADTYARVVSGQMGRLLGKPFVIENIAGAGGTIGSTRAMRANRDGYTILIGNTGTHAYSVAHCSR